MADLPYTKNIWKAESIFSQHGGTSTSTASAGSAGLAGNDGTMDNLNSINSPNRRSACLIRPPNADKAASDSAQLPAIGLRGRAAIVDVPTAEPAKVAEAAVEERLRSQPAIANVAMRREAARSDLRMYVRTADDPSEQPTRWCVR